MKTNSSHKKIKITFIVVGLVAAIVLASATSARAATWTQKADMPTPRWGHSAAVVSGKIYVIGGTNERDELSERQTYLICGGIRPGH